MERKECPLQMHLFSLDLFPYYAVVSLTSWSCLPAAGSSGCPDLRRRPHCGAACHLAPEACRRTVPAAIPSGYGLMWEAALGSQVAMFNHTLFSHTLWPVHLDCAPIKSLLVAYIKYWKCLHSYQSRKCFSNPKKLYATPAWMTDQELPQLTEPRGS